jgi:hypothetical protein
VPAGVKQFIVVEFGTLIDVAEFPPKVKELTLKKPLPKIVTAVPPNVDPEVGLTESK